MVSLTEKFVFLFDFLSTISQLLIKPEEADLSISEDQEELIIDFSESELFTVKQTSKNVINTNDKVSINNTMAVQLFVT